MPRFSSLVIWVSVSLLILGSKERPEVKEEREDLLIPVVSRSPVLSFEKEAAVLGQCKLANQVQKLLIFSSYVPAGLFRDGAALELVGLRNPGPSLQTTSQGADQPTVPSVNKAYCNTVMLIILYSVHGCVHTDRVYVPSDIYTCQTKIFTIIIYCISKQRRVWPLLISYCAPLRDSKMEKRKKESQILNLDSRKNIKGIISMRLHPPSSHRKCWCH